MDKRQELAVTGIVSDRTPRPLLAPMMEFDLSAEALRLRNETPFSDHGHNARTLVKHSEFRLVLVSLSAGHRIEEQHSDERIALQPLMGRLRVEVPTERPVLLPGRLLALDRGVPHALEAEMDTDFLLWIGWSGD